MEPGLSYFPHVLLRFAGLSVQYRRSGSNRHDAFAPPDFESGASTNSATPAREPHHYTNVQRSFGARSVLP